MNHWCESCARKNLCYVVDGRPKCFVPITNTASGTPESYLAKSLRYSRDSHEIAKDESNCDTCKHNKLEWYSEVCDGCSKAHSNYEPQDDDDTNGKDGYFYELKDEPQTEREDE